MGQLQPEEADAIKKASEESIMSVPMEEGDVILVDNYRVLHGRDIFKGDRFHAGELRRNYSNYKTARAQGQ